MSNLPDDTRPPRRQRLQRVLAASLDRGFTTRLAIALPLSLLVALLTSPGVWRHVPRYRLGQYTIAAIRAPFDFSVIDGVATERRREEAARLTAPVVTFDPTVPATITQAVSAAFASVAKWFPAAELRRQPTEADLKGLTRARQAALKKRLAAEADRFLRDQLAEAVPAFERAVGVRLAPEDQALLTKEQFGPTLAAAFAALVADLYVRPVAGSLASIRRLAEGDPVTKDGPGRVSIRNAAKGIERSISNFTELQELSGIVASLPARAQAVLPSLDPRLRTVLVRIAAAQLRPNLSPDLATTRARQEGAARAVIPISLNFHRNQLIAGEGQEVTRETVLALDALRRRALPPAYYRRLIGFGLIFCVLLMVVFGQAGSNGDAWPHGRRQFIYAASTLATFALLFRLWLFTVDMIVNAAPGAPQLGLVVLWPLAALPMLSALVCGPRMALAHLAAVALLVGLLSDSGVLLTAYAFIVGLVGARAVRRCTRRTCVLRAGVAAGIAGVAMSVALLLLREDAAWVDTSSLLTLPMAFGGGLLAALATIAASSVVEWLFGYTSNMTLLELVSYEHPLLKRLMIEAPGTFQHSLAISILADAAAEAIGANALLARVGALYHDAGKIRHRDFFVENQVGSNPHDTRQPLESARIIRSHVDDGVAMLRQYGIDDRIAAFVREHHGTARIQYFAAKAEASGQAVDPDEFRYPGPRPRTRETAVVMIADRVEAVSRTIGEATEQDYRRMVSQIIEGAIRDGQLGDCPLTLGDLARIETAMVHVLVGVHHQRIRYPSQTASRKPGGAGAE